MSTTDFISLFLHFLVLSPMSIGGAITTVPEMHRFLVDQNHWLSETQFTTSIALAQAEGLDAHARSIAARLNRKR